MSASVCEVCGSIPDFAAANLREGERLPDAVLKLVDDYPYPEGFWDTSKEYELTKKCPLCGQLYTYNYYYEFSVGYVEESVWIERRSDLHTHRELMEMHVRALFTHDARSRLLRVNEPGGSEAPAPRLFLGRTPGGAVWRFRSDVPDALAAELEALCADEPASVEFDSAPRHVEEYVRLLEGHAPVREVEAGPAYRFDEYAEPSRPLLSITEANAELLRGGFEELMDEPPTWQPFVAVVEESRAVSVCRSVRITEEAHEAGVETLPEFRGKGYAKDAVAGWARLVQASGAAPLYSTSWENNASRALAKKLRLEFYGADFHVT